MERIDSDGADGLGWNGFNRIERLDSDGADGLGWSGLRRERVGESRPWEEVRGGAEGGRRGEVGGALETRVLREA
jgi:hypothetical protein